MQNNITQPHYIVAVSGGVDSVVLLDMLMRHNVGPLVVAHVDHGMRKDSANDAQFVRSLAKRHQLQYELLQLQLGLGASEDIARQARYAFFRQLQDSYGGPIVTAHHADDVVETIALNLQRGTGWRGLAVMGAPDIHRPLTGYFKDELIAYAKKHSLKWREDVTNTQPIYARNRLRPQLQQLPRQLRLELLALWRQQQKVARQIDEQVAPLVNCRRYFYIMTPPRVAREVLRATLLQAGVSRTRPQLDALVLAIKTAKNGTQRPLGKTHTMVFSKTDFRILPS